MAAVAAAESSQASPRGAERRGAFGLIGQAYGLKSAARKERVTLGAAAAAMAALTGAISSRRPAK